MSITEPTDEEYLAQLGQLVTNRLGKPATPSQIVETVDPTNENEDDDNGTDPSAEQEMESDDESGVDSPGDTDSGDSGSATARDEVTDSPPPNEPASQPEIDPQLQEVINFRNWLAANPEAALKIQQALSDEYELTKKQPTTPEPTQPTLTDLDLDDPAIAALYARQQSYEEQLKAAREIIERHDRQFSQQTEQTTTSLVNRAKASFAKQHNLTDEEVTEIDVVAARLNVLPSLNRGINPITGEPVPNDPLSAVEMALDIAYRTIPKYQQREIESLKSTLTKEQRNASQRKSKLSSLGGSNGSIPRGQPEQPPKNMADARQRAIQHLTDALGITE